MGLAPAAPVDDAAGVAPAAGLGVAAAPELGVPEAPEEAPPAPEDAVVFAVCAVQSKLGAPLELPELLELLEEPPELLELLCEHKTTSLLVVSIYQAEVPPPPLLDEEELGLVPKSGMNVDWLPLLLVVAAEGV